MDIALYQKYLQQYVNEAIQKTNGTNRMISEYLWEIQLGKFLVRNREEKQRALTDARKAFDDHRHWPVEIVLSHLGIEAPEG